MEIEIPMLSSKRIIILMNYLEDVGEDLAVTNETKKCPYCGGEIKAVALKCKHCGKFLEEVKSGDIIYQEPLKNNKGRNIGIGCAWFLGIFIILGIIGSFLDLSYLFTRFAKTPFSGLILQNCIAKVVFCEIRPEHVGKK